MTKEYLTPALDAKLTAYRDISADCGKRNEGKNYLPHEKEICKFLGIPAPDFRMFNGGHNKKKQ